MIFQLFACQCQKDSLESQLKTRDGTIDSLRQQHQQQLQKVGT